MKYMLIMNTPRDGYDQYFAWPQEMLEANMAFMTNFTRKVAAAGELVSGAGLASPVDARLVRAGAGGKPVTDGVFPEAKEFLAGFWIVDVENAQRAYELAAEISTAPGAPVKGADGRTIEHLWVEVREVMGKENCSGDFAT